jgi:CheY-like chemotaxis protein
MDGNMPEMNGYETCKAIRELCHEHKVQQPIIIGVTGHTEIMYDEMAIKSGMNMVCHKPVNPQSLKSILLKMNYL